jgi:hypothetical protein
MNKDLKWYQDWIDDLIEIGRYDNSKSVSDEDVEEHTCETCRHFRPNADGVYGECLKWGGKVHRDMKATCWE